MTTEHEYNCDLLTMTVCNVLSVQINQAKLIVVLFHFLPFIEAVK